MGVFKVVDNFLLVFLLNSSIFYPFMIISIHFNTVLHYFNGQQLGDKQNESTNNRKNKWILRKNEYLFYSMAFGIHWETDKEIN